MPTPPEHTARLNVGHMTEAITESPPHAGRGGGELEVPLQVR